MGRKYEDFTGKTINGIFVECIVEEVGKSGRHRRWKCVCPKCNKEFVTASHHLKNICMCSQCSRSQYKDLSNQKFGKLFVKQRYHDKLSKRVEFLCECECGKTIIVQGNHLTSGETRSCGCELSRGESQILKILKTNNIKYETQKRFQGCIDKKELPFDFYIPDKNAVIEFNGIQHYKSIDFFGGEAQLEYTQRHDLIKKKYCSAHGITYIPIRYDDDIYKKLTSHNIVMKR